MAIRRVLVPVDYSACSRGALAVAVEVARRFEATLDVVHVWDRPSYVTEAVMASKEPIHGQSLFRLIEENAERDLREFLKGFGLPGRLTSGDPASAILHELKAGKHDLVIMGTHGRTGISHLLMGSVAEKIARLAAVPVMTVPDESAQALRR